MWCDIIWYLIHTDIPAYWSILAEAVVCFSLYHISVCWFCWSSTTTTSTCAQKLPCLGSCCSPFWTTWGQARKRTGCCQNGGSAEVAMWLCPACGGNCIQVAKKIGWWGILGPKLQEKYVHPSGADLHRSELQGSTTCWSKIRQNDTSHPSNHQSLGGYPLVICYIAIENGHRNSGFSH